MSKIVRLTVENVMRLRAVEIRPDGNFILVGGRNAQGKSSLLDSIQMALAGKGAVCEEPLRRGASKGSVVCELENLVVRRTFTKKGGSSLVVTAKDGSKISSPQGVLDELASGLTFDPLDFLNMKPAKQFETVRELVGVDFTELDAQRLAAYNERTVVSKDIKSKGANLDSIPAYPDAPDTEVSISGLMAELEEVEDSNEHAVQAKSELEALNTQILKAQSDIMRLQSQIKRWKAKRAELET